MQQAPDRLSALRVLFFSVSSALISFAYDERKEPNPRGTENAEDAKETAGCPIVRNAFQRRIILLVPAGL
jgi:hypothetical protein